MKIDRSAEALWRGSVREGHGAITTASGVLKETPYAFKTRFESQPGTNPEELLAAAHAACFSMALSAQLSDAGIAPEQIHTKAIITLEKLDSGFKVTKSALELHAKVPGIDAARFAELALAAKTGCPVSRLYNTEITLSIQLDD